MYSLLIVDDEKYAADVLARQIHWNDLDIGQVFKASCAKDAMKIVENNPIDLLICDIVMPGRNGLQLFEWVKENYPDTENIFLTGYADFSYAQRALQLDSYDYLLKPVDYEKLKEVAGMALKRVKNRRKMDEFYQTYQKYKNDWKFQQPVLVERLWQDILSERLSLSREYLNRVFQNYGMELTDQDSVLPILIEADDWGVYLNYQDEEIMKFAIRNVTAEIFLSDMPGTVIQDHKGNNMILLYQTLNTGSIDLSKVESTCKRLIESCNTNLLCRVCCYIGKQTSPLSLPEAYREILEMEKDNEGESNKVVLNKQKRRADTIAFPLPDYHEWAILIEAGKKEEALSRIKAQLRKLEQGGAAAEIVEAYGFALFHVVYQVLHQKNISVYQVFNIREISEGVSCIRSAARLQKWILRFVSKATDCVRAGNKGNSAVVEKVLEYIHEHLDQDFTREDVATHVYLNADYLSRLFKREMHESLSNYIVKARIEKAKDLLTNTNDKVSSIGAMVGYNQFSSFTRIFKLTVGLSPQEYRKKFQN